MSFKHFIQLCKKYIFWLVFFPITISASVYYFTYNEKKIFSSETVIYTGIATGYSLSGSNKGDYYSTSAAFDNLLTLILSRETKQQVAIKLLAKHLFLKKNDAKILTTKSYEELHQLIPNSLSIQLVKSTEDSTFESIKNYSFSTSDNIIYKIINSDNPYYSLNALKNIKAYRVNNSDLIKITYETNDAAICKQTLDILIDAFIKNNLLLRQGETESVIAYFEKESNKAYIKLDSLEHLFLEFNKKNNIINYYEQTKAVAAEKENLYALNHILEMDKNANDSALANVNHNLKGRLHQIVYGTDILKEREKLSDIYNKIALIKTISNNSFAQKGTTDSLENISSKIESQLQKTIDKLYSASNTPNGIPTKLVLDEWLKATLAFEQSKAKLLVMDRRKKEFVEEYKKFAPLGAQLKTIERQITVAEQEYLEKLHALSLARLAQQNNQLTAKIHLIDSPNLPQKPNPSIRFVLVLIGFLVGLFMVFGIIISSILINKTKQYPLVVLKKLNIPILGIYPFYTNNELSMNKANVRLLQQLLANVDNKKNPITIGVFCIQEAEGKSTIIKAWLKGLKAAGESAAVVSWENNSSLINELSNNNKFLFIEFPALENLILTKSAMPEINNIIIVCNNNKIWNRQDKELLEILYKISNNKPMAVLNGLTKDAVANYIETV